MFACGCTGEARFAVAKKVKAVGECNAGEKNKNVSICNSTVHSDLRCPTAQREEPVSLITSLPTSLLVEEGGGGEEKVQKCWPKSPTTTTPQRCKKVRQGRPVVSFGYPVRRDVNYLIVCRFEDDKCMCMFPHTHTYICVCLYVQLTALVARR